MQSQADIKGMNKKMPNGKRIREMERKVSRQNKVVLTQSSNEDSSSNFVRKQSQTPSLNLQEPTSKLISAQITARQRNKTEAKPT